MKKINVDLIKLKKLYAERVLVKDISKELRVSKATIYRRLRKLKIKKRETPRKYYVDEYYFDNIDCEDKAYWLGFLFADGCVRTNSDQLAVNLSKKDIDHLHKFMSSIGANYPIFEFKKDIYDLCGFCINSKKLCSTLRNIGMRANQKIHYERIDKNLERHYWRGYVDGDGCLGLKEHKRKTVRNQLVYSLGVVGEHRLVFPFSQFCVKHIDSNAKIKEYKNYSIYRLHGNIAFEICKLLYENCSIYLTRKRKMFLHMKECNENQILFRN